MTEPLTKKELDAIKWLATLAQEESPVAAMTATSERARTALGLIGNAMAGIKRTPPTLYWTVHLEHHHVMCGTWDEVLNRVKLALEDDTPIIKVTAVKSGR